MPADNCVHGVEHLVFPVVVGAPRHVHNLYEISTESLIDLVEANAHHNDINFIVDVNGQNNYWYELIDELQWRTYRNV